MKFNELKVASPKSSKRVGRGISAGQGKTAGRGTKGQKSRAGSKRRPGFEGGQNPLIQRLPKLRGFKSHRTKAEVVYTGQLNALAAKIDNFVLAEAGLTSNPFVSVKVVVNGEITKKLAVVKLQSATAGAQAAIKKAGGTFEAVPRIGRPKKDGVIKKQK